MVLRPPFWPPFSLPGDHRATMVTALVVIVLLLLFLLLVGKPGPQAAY